MQAATLASLLLFSPLAAMAAAPSRSMTAKIAVGDRFSIALPCAPGTGYEWEVKSIDRKIAAPVGRIAFESGQRKRRLIGGGGDCLATFQGAQPGKTTAVLVYRRSWEKAQPAETVTLRLTVLPKKSK